MAYEFKLPDLGEGLTEGEIARWLVAGGPGDRGGRPARRDRDRQDDGRDPVAGRRRRLEDPRRRRRGRPGRHRARRDRRQTARRSRSAGRAAGRSASPAARTDKVRATPLVRRLAQELGVDLATDRGHRAAGAHHRGRRSRRRSRGSGAQPAERREPIRGIRRQMFEHLTRAHREIPPVTWVEECDFTDVDLKRLAAARAEGGRGVAAGVPGAERARRRQRARLARPLRHRHRGADRAGARRPGRARLRLAFARRARRRGEAPRRAAQAGKLAPEELRGGTFTVTSAGKSAGLFVTPLINHPQVAILGVYRIEERAVVRDGEVVVRRMGNVSVTFDHRVIDGKRAADFGLAVIARLEPSLGRVDRLARARASRASTRSSARSRGPRAARRPACPSRGRVTAPRRCGSAPRDRAARRRRPSSRAACPRSLRAMCASRLSIRRAGPERREVKKTSSGRASSARGLRWRIG